jgi:predicted RNase H-related nuclease YkuK (DUF458 family)
VPRIRERWAGISSIPVNSFSHVYSLNTDMTSWEDKELYKILLISLQVSQILDIIPLTVHLDINSKYQMKKQIL